MAEQHPRTLYTKELIRKGRGYPFWYPEPDSSASAEFKERGIRPGDVGILNNDGGFNFLFSIFSDANGPIDAGRAPPGFQPLPEPISRDVQIYPAHGNVLKSQHVSCREVLVDASAQGLQSIADAGVSFDVSITEASAAILFLPNYSTKYEALNKALIEDYAQRHGVSWYNYVNGMLGRKAPNGSLYLVTGCDKTTTWGNAVVGRTDRSFTFSLKCALAASTGGVTVKVANSWVGDSGVENGLFPNPFAHYSYPTDRENQCVFARGFTISISESLFNKSRWKSVPYHLDGSSKDRVPSFDAKSAPLPLSNEKTGFWARASSFFGFGAVLEDPDSDQNRMLADVDDRSLVAKVSKFPPGESELLNPSVAANEYLLNMDPSLEIVILHDEEWMEVMHQYEDTHFTEEELWYQIRNRLIDAHIFKLSKSKLNNAGVLVPSQSGRGQAQIESISERIQELEDFEKRLAVHYGMSDPIDSVNVFQEAKRQAFTNRDHRTMTDLNKLDELLKLRIKYPTPSSLEPLINTQISTPTMVYSQPQTLL